MTTKKEIEEELMKTKQRIVEFEETNKSLFKGIDELREEKKSLKERIAEVESLLAETIAQLEEESIPTSVQSTPLYTGTVRDVQAPYVSYKVHKVDSGKFPKIETTIKVSGAVEELKMVDVEIRLNELRKQIQEHFDEGEQIEIPP